MLPPIASRFVAGETPAEALMHAHDIDDRGVGAILNLLGEHYDDPADAAADREAYCDLLADVGAADARVCISVKPSQVGLDIGEDLFTENLTAIADAAAEADAFVWVDMEDHTTVDTTLDAWEPLAREYPGRLGLCLQANLKRTPEDLDRLAEVPGKLRLVKGAYDPPKSVAYRDKARVNEAYRDLIEQAFADYTGTVAVGSHDPAMIEYATDLREAYDTDFEIQMLMGVRTEAQFELAEEYPVWQYVPYGDKWLSYFYRRVMERKENALFAARAVLGR